MDYRKDTHLGLSMLEFFEWEGTLGIKNLSPVQKMVLKVIQGEPLNATEPVRLDHPYQEQVFENEIEMYKYFSGKSEYEPGMYSDVSLCWGRRCLEIDTDVLTPKGPVKIQNLKKGDIVYGVNEDGSVSPTTVLELYDTGIQEVYPLFCAKNKISAATKNHVWSGSTGSNGDMFRKRKLMTTEELGGKYASVERTFVKVPLGTVHEPHAYALGALLGDGCSRAATSARIWISSANDAIPSKLADILGAQFKRNHESNYNWILYGENPIQCNHYKEWCKGRYAHEKIVDMNVIHTWDRESCLAFMAGLLDTDGSVHESNDTKSLNFSFGCQAKPVVDAFAELFYTLWQHRLDVQIDDRARYKNGAVHIVKTKSNLYIKMALKELDKYLVTPSKKWKPEYSDFPEQRSHTRLGMRLGEAYKAQTFDIAVSNSTNLYVLANEGLITKNSGKSTTCGAGIAIYYATQFDYKPYLGTSPYATIPIISPTKTQAGEVYAAIKNMFLRSTYLFDTFLDGKIDNFRDEYTEDKIGKDDALVGGMIRLNNKVVIKVMAADVSKMRGFAVPFAILDEVCFFGMEGSDSKNTDVGIYEALAPALSQFQSVEGMAMVLKISSPNGESGLMYTDYERRNEEDVLHLQVPTWYANPTISVKYLEKQKKKGMSYFNREYGAQYTASEASYLDPALVEDCRLRGLQDREPLPQYRYAAAMDYATKDDYWAFVIGHKETFIDPVDKVRKEKTIIDFVRYWRGISGAELNPDLVIEEISGYLKRYRVAYCVADQYAYAAVRQIFMRYGCQTKEFKITNASKLKYFYSLQLAINSKQLQIVDVPLAFKHLKDLREKRSTSSSTVRVEHAQNCKDDIANAMALVVYQFDKTSPLYIGYTHEEEDATPTTKDGAGRQIAMPTAQDVAEHVGLSEFYDNRAEEKKREEGGDDDSDDGSGFWFVF
jgi:hypothetical protein